MDKIKALAGSVILLADNMRSDATAAGAAAEPEALKKALEKLSSGLDVLTELARGAITEADAI